GWTAGAGFEYAITNNLTAKIEGLYTDLGLGSSYENPYGTNAYLKTTVSFATVRAGLNWKFDFGAPSN
ncbi:MAG: outer membrane protein, partial [Roseiarcus sp.]